MKCAITYTPTEISFGPILLRNQPPESAFATAARLGYDGVEIHLRRSSDIDWDKVDNLCRKYGLMVTTIGTGMAGVMDGLTFTDPDPTVRRRATKLVKEYIVNAAGLGAAVTIGFLNGRMGTGIRRNPEIYKALLECYHDVAQTAEAHEVTVLCEPLNRYETDYPNTAEEGLSLMEQVGSPQIKLLCDTYHMNIEEKDFSESFYHVGRRLGYVHFADSNRYGLGCGHIPFKRIIGTLKKIGYDGVIGLEHLPQTDPIESAKKSIEMVRQLLDTISEIS